MEEKKRRRAGCEHGKRPSSCSKCNLCVHGIFKPSCLQGCSKLCPHGFKANKCVNCKPKSSCQHGNVSFCKDVSCELGICVPHSRIYWKAIKKYGCPLCALPPPKEPPTPTGWHSLYELRGSATMDTTRCSHDKWTFACRDCGLCRHGGYRPECEEGCFIKCWHGHKPECCHECNQNRCVHDKFLRCNKCGFSTPLPRLHRLPGLTAALEGAEES
eukprot:jgi/Mesvir1/1470/Mv14454-RA.1